MNFRDAQQDMRAAYYGGAPGVAVSGLVWLASGTVAQLGTLQAAALTLFFGGMFIHPFSVVLAKGLGRSGQHAKGNPLAALALESTLLLFIGLFLAFAIVQVRADWFFPTVLMIVGGRYLLFSSLYGNRTYWGLGGALVAVGMLSIALGPPLAVCALAGGGLETVFAGYLGWREKGAASR